MKNDGSVSGINYEFRIMGNPETVTRSIKKVITETFQVSESAMCRFQYLNMPGNYYRPNGKEPLELSSEEFMRAFESEKHVYMGEQKASIFLIPKELASEMPVNLDSEILFTDLRKLNSDDVKRIRSSGLARSSRR